MTDAAFSGAGYGLAALQVYSSFQQAEITRQFSNLQSRVGALNAQFAELDAYKTEQAGYSTAARYGSVVDKTIGAQRSGYAEQGADVSYGTAKNVQDQTRTVGYLNQLDMIRQARERALGIQRTAINYRLGATTAQTQGSLDAGSMETAGVLQAGSTALSGYRRT